jgi:hypothetical protein
MWHSVVDPRDLGELQLRAMVESAAARQRFIATAGEPLSLRRCVPTKGNHGDCTA